jgi:arylsulfatase A-like enzyme
LRDGKGTTYEGGLRVPAIFRWPGRIPAARKSDAVAANFDLLPTFARLAGAPLPAGRILDGRDIWPLLSAETDRSPHQHFHYMSGSPDGQVNYRGIRNERWKLLVATDGEGGVTGKELYDLGADVGERFNRLEQHPEIAQELAAAAGVFYRKLRSQLRPAGWRAAP